jgi:hypothetical protein
VHRFYFFAISDWAQLAVRLVSEARFFPNPKCALATIFWHLNLDSIF